MGRWEPDAAGRLREAALELFVEQGYDATTVADIAERAGLTARTFFRHFADKREVLFAGSDQLEAEMVAAMDAAPRRRADAGRLGRSRRRRDRARSASRFARRRQAVIAANPELQERELMKLASLAAALATACAPRGRRARGQPRRGDSDGRAPHRLRALGGRIG